MNKQEVRGFEVATAMYSLDLEDTEGYVDLKRRPARERTMIVGAILDITLQKMPPVIRMSISGNNYDPNRTSNRTNTYSKNQLREWAEKLSKGLFLSVKRRDNQGWLQNFNEEKLEEYGDNWLETVNSTLDWG